MELNVVQKLSESQLVCCTITAGQREDSLGWRRALTIVCRGRWSAGEGRYGPSLAMDLASPAVACVAHFGNDNHADGMVR